MDSLDALYRTQLAAAQTGSSSQTTASSGNTGTCGVSFEELLASMGGTSGSDTSAQMQQYLLSGLADGSIDISNSQQLVAALLGSSEGESSLGNLTNSMDTSMLSQNSLSALFDLSQSAEEDWLQKILEALTASQTSSDDAGATYDYYQSMAALTEAQKKILEG